MDTTEKNVMSWVPSLWENANHFDEKSDWDAVCNALYGALQACIRVYADDDYMAYTLLAKVARQRRLDCITSKYKEAA